MTLEEVSKIPVKQLDSLFSDFGAVLGIYANSSSALPFGAISTAFERYQKRFLLQASARHLLPYERVVKCLRTLIPGHSTVDCYFSPEVGKGHFKNFQVCNSIWSCAVCGAKISERRRLEFEEVLEVWLVAGRQNSNVLLSMTVAHQRSDQLVDIRNGLMAAFAWFKGSRVWRRIKADYGWVGDARAQENTWGIVHGHHPHLHLLGFLNKTLDKARFEAFENECKAHWLKALRTKGMSGNWEHALDVRGTDGAVGSYIHKAWGIEREMTKGVVKLGKGTNRSMTQLLMDYSNREDVLGCTWQQSGAIWIEYAKTYKGKRQHEWGRGDNNMRQRLGLVKEKTDVELNTDTEQASTLTVGVSKSDLKLILANNAMPEFKAAVDTGEVGEIQALIEKLQEAKVS